MENLENEVTKRMEDEAIRNEALVEEKGDVGITQPIEKEIEARVKAEDAVKEAREAAIAAAEPTPSSSSIEEAVEDIIENRTPETEEGIWDKIKSIFK